MIIGLIEHDRGRLNETSLEMLTAGRDLAGRLSTSLAGVIVGEAGDSLAESLQSYGVSKVYLVHHDLLDDYAPEAWAESLIQLTQSHTTDAVMAAGSERGNEVMAYVAAKTDLPMAANCTEIHPGEEYQITRIRWGGALFEEATLKGSPKLLTIAPHMIPVVESPAEGSFIIEEFFPSLNEEHFRVKVVDRVEVEGGVSLANARVVVGGGRGVGSAEGFNVLEDLASLLGGVVGGSRVATNNGWRPHADQIGQTGTRISPDIYIACGISGATQHWVGCMGSKKILAINTDPESPIISKADYAIIGDLHTIIPSLCEEVKKAGL